MVLMDNIRSPDQPSRLMNDSRGDLTADQITQIDELADQFEAEFQAGTNWIQGDHALSIQQLREGWS